MTGFGASASDDVRGYAVRVEVRSVNHRHLQVKTRGTNELAFLEGEIDKLVKKRLARGSVSVFVKATPLHASTARINGEALRGYKREIAGLARELGIGGNLSLDTLLSLPGVIDSPDNGGADVDKLKRPLLKLVGEALDRLVEMRETEGAALAADLRKNARAIAGLVAKIRRRMPQVVQAHQQGLEKRLRELVEGRASVESSDLAREAALLADRLDVSEEIARLGSHLDQLALFLEQGGGLGRKLDFLVQEIFREINTIGSKCSDAKVAHWVVDAKTHAERLREQVQNVE